MQNRALELIVGFFFCLGIAAIFILTFKVASLESVGGSDTYRVTAAFENIGGLKPGSSVTMAGVRIGRVRTIEIDRQTFQAIATLEMSSDYNTIPKDSSAKILTAGLLGEQYIGLEPGGDLDNLSDGDKILLTQSALVLENLIGQFVTSMASKDKSE